MILLMMIHHVIPTESIAPIQAAPDEPEPIGVEVVNDDLQIKGVDYDNETVVDEPEVTHADDGDLFVPVEPPANLVITPCLSWAMKKLEIDGVTPQYWKHVPGGGRSYLQWQTCMLNRMDYNKPL